ncbi:MAG: PilZ domain-containing protein [Deltaproteobacteria bacterium]|nr:PilZ domain-containing protein [Deltaproteobacteria bacterium]MBI4373640.1 PilZ domain-containing protein [Deltaproteobacteria bacterium]
MPSLQEQRRHARLDIALSVNYVIQKPGGELSEIAESKSADVSAGGIRLMTPHLLERGTLLHLEIQLLDREDQEPIRAQGEVVWQNQLSDHSFETGAIIREMDERDKHRFMDFIYNQMARLVEANGVPTRYLH